MITKDMTIAEVMRKDPDVAPVFLSYGMHCLYCPVSSGESIEQASRVHGVNPDELITSLNEYFEMSGTEV